MASVWPDCIRAAPCYHALVQAAIEGGYAGSLDGFKGRWNTIRSQGCARHRACLDLHRVFTQTQRYERAE
jgi:hypothetical protein